MADGETVRDKDLLQPFPVSHETTPEITRHRSELSLNIPDIENFQQLGLGRGVDATSLTPWHNITPRQMRDVTTDNIVVTREKAKTEHYKEVICSEKTHHEKVMASADDPHGNIQLGVFAENIRSKSKDAIIEGDKVQTRSVAFRDDFVWTPPDDAKVLTTSSVPVANDESLGYTEAKLYQVILSYIDHRQKYDKQAGKTRNDKSIEKLVGDDASTKLGDYLQSLKQDSTEIEKACRYFVNQIQATHYIHALELGAYKCQVTNNVKQERAVNVGSQSKIKKIFGLECFAGASRHDMDYETRSVTIGRMEYEDGQVSRVTEEGVITIHLKPLHTLIERHLYIRQAMESAIKGYIMQRKQEESENEKEGPFRISCSSSKVYWKVNDENRLVGTENTEDSSLFHFVMNKDSADCEDMNTFWIATADSNPKSVRVTRKDCPLKVKDMVVEKKHKHLTLHKPDREAAPVNIHSFTTGGLYYFKRAKGNRYIAMETTHCDTSSSTQYTVKCVRTTLLTSLDHQQNPPHKWILFKLHPEKAELKPIEITRRDGMSQRKMRRGRAKVASDGDTTEVDVIEYEDEHQLQTSVNLDDISYDESDQEFLQSTQFAQLFEKN